MKRMLACACAGLLASAGVGWGRDVQCTSSTVDAVRSPDGVHRAVTLEAACVHPDGAKVVYDSVCVVAGDEIAGADNQVLRMVAALQRPKLRWVAPDHLDIGLAGADPSARERSAIDTIRVTFSLPKAKGGSAAGRKKPG